MTSVILKYPLDLTGKNANNLVTGEVHVLNTGVNRAFVPSYGPFFTKSLVVREASTNKLLTANVHYKAIQLEPTATADSGLEVCCIIVITDTSISSRVIIDYQVVGGDYSASVYALQQMIDALNLDNRTVAWGDIIGKPSEYAPSEHMHDAGDLYGFEYLVTAIEELKQAILIGDDASHDAIYDYVDAKNLGQDNLLTALTNNFNAHKNDINNPHGTTKAQVGLSAVLNYGVADSAAAKAGTSNALYMTPLRVKEAISYIAGDMLANHIADINNPHQTTKVQVGLGSVQNYAMATDAEATTCLVANKYMSPAAVKIALQNIQVNNTLKFNGKLLSEVMVDVAASTVANATKFNSLSYAEVSKAWNDAITAALINYVPKSQVNTVDDIWSNIANKIAYVTTDGVLDIGKYVDFHNVGSTGDYDVRLYSEGNVLKVIGGFNWSGIATGDGTNITNVNAAKLGGYTAASFMKTDEADGFQPLIQYSRAAESATVNYIKVAEVTTNISSGANDVTMLVSGLEGFGSTFGITAIVRFGSRATGANLQVTQLIGRAAASNWGWVKNATTGKTELWLKSSTYRNTLNITVLNKANGAVGILSAVTVEPAGITYITDSAVLYTGEKAGSAGDSDRLAGKTLAEVQTYVLAGKAADADKLDGVHLADIYTQVGTMTVANATKFAGSTDQQWKDYIYECKVKEAYTADNSLNFAGYTFPLAKAEVLKGTAADSTRFGGKTYAEAKTDILLGNATTASTADNAMRLGGRTYVETLTDFIGQGKITFVAAADILKSAPTATNPYANKVPWISSTGLTYLGNKLALYTADTLAAQVLTAVTTSHSNATITNGVTTGADFTSTCLQTDEFLVDKMFCNSVGNGAGNGNNRLQFAGTNDTGGDLSKANNVNIRSWYGFSVQSSCFHDLSSYNKIALSVNARTGDLHWRGVAYGNGAGIANVNAQLLDGINSSQFMRSDNVVTKSVVVSVDNRGPAWGSTGFKPADGQTYIVNVSWAYQTSPYYSYFTGGFVFGCVSGNGNNLFTTVSGTVDGGGSYGERSAWRINKGGYLEIYCNCAGNTNMSHDKNINITINVKIKPIF